MRNNKGETPRDVAVRFGKTKCASLLSPYTSTDDKTEGDNDDDPTAMSVERAKEKVERLQGQVMAAKTRLRELGGELIEDSEIELLKTEHQR